LVQWFTAGPALDPGVRATMLEGAGDDWPTPQGWRPNVDVCETDEYVVVAVELAGVSQADVELTFESGRLIVRGLRKPLKPSEVSSCQRIEIRYGPFERIIPILCRIDAHSNITATYREGLLEVRLPKVRRAEPAAVRVEIG
jgi:HSP20 family protein